VRWSPGRRRSLRGQKFGEEAQDVVLSRGVGWIEFAVASEETTEAGGFEIHVDEEDVTAPSGERVGDVRCCEASSYAAFEAVEGEDPGGRHRQGSGLSARRPFETWAQLFRRQPVWG
jgi:hypothetical protein